ncbi:unnamed protein product [Symbiodinium sp. CCMP2592]|nr:unnamed protein product [Symbiodinium sp. CCMP2592]
MDSFHAGRAWTWPRWPWRAAFPSFQQTLPQGWQAAPARPVLTSSPAAAALRPQSPSSIRTPPPKHKVTAPLSAKKEENPKKRKRVDAVVGFNLDQPEKTSAAIVCDFMQPHSQFYDLCLCIGFDMKRLNHTKPGEDRGVKFETLIVENGWQSTVTCTANSAACETASVWSGRGFQGEVKSDELSAKNSAADAFRDDPDVRSTAWQLEPSKRVVWLNEQRKQHKRAMRSGSAGSAKPG